MENAMIDVFEEVFDIIVCFPIFRILLVMFSIGLFMKALKVAFCDVDYPSASYVTHEPVRVTISEQPITQPVTESVPDTVEEKLSDFFWECPYCDSLNDIHEPVCPHCNAPRMKIGEIA